MPSMVATKNATGGNAPLGWAAFDGAVIELGRAAGGRDGFALDNETPRHGVLVGPFSLASPLVTGGEYPRAQGRRGALGGRFQLQCAPMQAASWESHCFSRQATLTGLQLWKWSMKQLNS